MVTETRDAKPAAMNAFELISLSRGLNLSGLFETRGQVSILIHICSCFSYNKAHLGFRGRVYASLQRKKVKHLWIFGNLDIVAAERLRKLSFS